MKKSKTNKAWKRAAAGALSVALVAGSVPANVGGFLTGSNGNSFVAFAEGETSEVEATALDASAAVDGVLTLTTGSYYLSDNSTVGRINIAKGATVTIDLKGYTINVPNGVCVSGNLTIEDSSENKTGTIVSEDNCAIYAFSDSIITINSGNINAQEFAVCVSSKVVNANVTINGGVFTTVDNVVLGFNGTARDAGTEDQVNTLTVNGGTFNGHITTPGYVACGIYCPQNDVVNVNGGTFNITGGAGIVARAGKVNITGGTFNCTGEATGMVGDSRVVVPCSALVFDVDANYPGLNNDAKITVTGGTFASDVANISPVGDCTGRISVQGGTFDEAPTAFLADGYIATNENDVYTVAFNNVATVGENAYSSLQAAINAAENGDTVTLNKDVLTSLSIEAGKNIVLDLNGHYIAKNNTQYGIVFNYGTLTIKDSVGNGGIDGKYPINIYANSTTVIESGNFTAQEFVVSGGNSTVNANVTINGGTFTSIDNAVLGFNGNKRDSGTENQVNTLTVNGGTFNGGITSSGYVACGIYCPQNDVVNVNGGTFNITGGAGIVARAGNVNITGGTFNCTGDATGKVGDSRVVVPCSALVFDVEAKYPGLNNDAKITVTGGTFASDVANISPVGNCTGRISVQGGTFSTSLDAYIADGYRQYEDGSVHGATSFYLNCIDVNGAATKNKLYYDETDIVGEYELPKAVYLDGYEFKGWYVYTGNTYDEDKLIAPGGDLYAAVKTLLGEDGMNYATVNVRVAYEKISQDATVSVTDGQIVGASENEKTYKIFNVSDVVTVKANDDTTQQFSHWVKKGSATSADVIVSYNQSYTFIVPEGGITLEAVYVANNSDVQAEGTGFIESVKCSGLNAAGKKTMSFVSVLNVPDGYYMVDAGVVAQKTDDLGGNELKKDNAKYVRVANPSRSSKTCKYTWSLTTSIFGTKWTVRPYLVYKSIETGVTYTVYGDAETKCVNDFNA